MLLWEGFSSRPPISRYCPFWLYLTVLLNPTSRRDASHMCLISLSPRHMCTTTTPFNVGGFLVFKFLKLIIYLMENLMQHTPFVIFFFLFLAELSCLLFEDDDNCCHSQKFLLSGYIAFSK